MSGAIIAAETNQIRAARENPITRAAGVLRKVIARQSTSNMVQFTYQKIACSYTTG